MKTLTLLTILLLTASHSAFADDRHIPGDNRPVHQGEIPWTMETTFTGVTDFVDRGQSASDEHDTVQTQFTLTHDSGAYVGIWASGVDFNDDEAKMELDYYVGYATELDENWSIDTFFTRYTYPGVDADLDYDFYELAAGATYTFDLASINGYMAWTPDNYADSGDFHYYNLNFDAPLPHDFSFGGEIAYSDIDDETRFASPDYTHWRLGVGYDWFDAHWRLDYHDTDLTEAECADICAERVVFSVARSF